MLAIDQSDRLLATEARGLLTRLDQVRPFALHETTVLAAALPFAALRGIEAFLLTGRDQLRRRVHGYLDWLEGSGQAATPAEQQRRFVVIRMEFNDVLTQLDLFTEVITQRSEHGTGVWLSGLDVLAADGLRVRAPAPAELPAVCYLARGPGAAIRRARTRLPGDRLNPVAIIRVPRERMVGSGVASSLIHEVGHQGAAQFRLVESLRLALRQRASADPEGQWPVFERWVSEIVADCWSVGQLGITATHGLLAVVSLPAHFVFRDSAGDPHPVPYLRVLISAAIGQALYPHQQFSAMVHTWKQLYPLDTLPPTRRAQLAAVESAIPAFVRLLLGHRPAALNGLCIGDLWPVHRRQPRQLLARFHRWVNEPEAMARAPACEVVAALGQAKLAGLLSPETESRLLVELLTAWAVRSSLEVEPRTDRDGRQPWVAYPHLPTTDRRSVPAS